MHFCFLHACSYGRRFLRENCEIYVQTEGRPSGLIPNSQLSISIIRLEISGFDLEYIRISSRRRQFTICYVLSI